MATQDVAEGSGRSWRHGWDCRRSSWCRRPAGRGPGPRFARRGRARHLRSSASSILKCRGGARRSSRRWRTWSLSSRVECSRHPGETPRRHHRPRGRDADRDRRQGVLAGPPGGRARRGKDHPLRSSPVCLPGRSRGQRLRARGRSGSRRRGGSPSSAWRPPAWLTTTRGSAGLRAASGFAVCVASGASAVAEFRRCSSGCRAGRCDAGRDHGRRSIGHALTNYAAVDLGLRGQTMTLASGCASRVDAIQWACAQIGAGRIVGALAGAADAPLATSVHAAWGKLGWLSRWGGPPARALRPTTRSATAPSWVRARACTMLEDLDHSRARGARVYAGGAGLRQRHGRPGPPHGGSSRRVPQAAMRGALAEARASAGRDRPRQCARRRGAATRPGRERGLPRGARTARVQHPVTSIKGMIGQPFAAGGALQVVASCFSLAEQFVPSDHEPRHSRARNATSTTCPAGAARAGEPRLVTSRAIGPTHSAVVLGRAADTLSPTPP